MIAANDKGSRWRHAVEMEFAEAGFETAVRGIGWAGDDITVRRPRRDQLGGAWEPELILSVEAKNHREIALSKFVDQASVQAASISASALPLVVAHRRGRASVDDAYFVMPGWAFIELVTR